MESVQASDPEIDEEREDASDLNQEVNQVRINLPDRISRLPDTLAGQLQAYRQLKSNRWRPERVAANSILFYSQHGILWEFFCETCGVKAVVELNLDHVLQFIKARLDARRSAKTINCSLSSLRSFLSFLKEDDIPIDPSLEHMQRLKESEQLPRYMTTEQVHRLKDEVEARVLSAGDQHQLYDALLIRATFYLLWQGGLRSGEVELLRFSDFYIFRANREQRLFVRDGKWRRGRAVYLTDVSLAAFDAYLAVRGVEPAGRFVFVRNGMPLKKNFLSQRLNAIGKQVDVYVSPHRLRHTFATQLLNVGCMVTSIQKLLGHSNLNTTMTYARAFDQTVMRDYFQAVDVMESQPDGIWFGLSDVHSR